MKIKGSILAVITLILALAGMESAWAWPTCPDGSISLKNEAGGYVCPSPTPSQQPVSNNVSGVASPHGTVSGTLGQTAKQNAEQNLTAQQKQEAELNAQQKLNAANNANQSAVTKSGPANTISGPATSTSGPASTKSGNINQEVNGSAGNNTLKSVSEGGKAELNGTVKGTFENNGKQSTTIGPVSSTSEGGKVTGSGNSTVDVAAQGGSVKNAGNGNGSGNTLAPVATSGSASEAQATGNGAGNSTSISTTITNKRIEVPVLFNPLPPTITTSGPMETHVTQCGPLMHIIKTPVKGTHVGIFSNTYIDLGNDMELAPVYDRNGVQVYYTEQKFANGVTRLFGSQAIITTALPNVSGASTFSIGYANNSGGGNGGAGSSSAMSRIVTKVIVSQCELPGAYMVASEKQVVGLTKEDLEAALKSNLRLEVYTDRVETKTVPCKLEEFTDASGKKLKMCRGPNGSYQANKVTREKAVGTATNAVKAEKK